MALAVQWRFPQGPDACGGGKSASSRSRSLTGRLFPCTYASGLVGECAAYEAMRPAGGTVRTSRQSPNQRQGAKGESKCHVSEGEAAPDAFDAWELASYAAEPWHNSHDCPMNIQVTRKGSVWWASPAESSRRVAQFRLLLTAGNVGEQHLGPSPRSARIPCELGEASCPAPQAACAGSRPAVSCHCESAYRWDDRCAGGGGLVIVLGRSFAGGRGAPGFRKELLWTRMRIWCFSVGRWSRSMRSSPSPRPWR